MNPSAATAGDSALQNLGATTAQSVWEPLPVSSWNADAARHLFRRAAWTARPEDVDRAVAEGLSHTLDRLFPAAVVSLPKPQLITGIEGDEHDFFNRIRAAEEIQKRQLRKEMRDRFQQAYQDLVMKWLQFAAEPVNAASEKWILCLSDIYVVAYQKVSWLGGFRLQGRALTQIVVFID